MKVAIKLGNAVAEVEYYGGATIEHDNSAGSRVHIPTANGRVTTGFMPPNEAAEFVDRLGVDFLHDKEYRKLDGGRLT